MQKRSRNASKPYLTDTMDISRKISIYLTVFLGAALVLSLGILTTVEDHQAHMEHREDLNDLQKALTALEHSADEPPRIWNQTRVEEIEGLIDTVEATSSGLALQGEYRAHRETIQQDVDDITTTWRYFESIDQMTGQEEPIRQHKAFLRAIEKTEEEVSSLDIAMRNRGESMLDRATLLAVLLILTLLVDVVISQYLFKRRFTGPIESLTDVVKRISKGETDVRIDTALKEREDEIGRLSRSFERTMTSLKLAMEQSAPILEEKNRSLKGVIQDKKEVEAELEETITTLHSTLNNIEEGILVVAPDGSVLHSNKQFQEMWNIPDELMENPDDEELLAHVKDQLKNPESFLERVRELYDSPEGEREDVIEFKDDRVFRRTFKPLRTDDRLIGWVWIFKDISDAEGSSNE